MSTPFTMPSGTSIPVFIEPNASGGHRLWDAGELLFEVIVSGVQLQDRRRLRGIAATVQQLGACLTEAGSLEVIVSADELPAGFARFISAALEIARWNERALDETPGHEDLVDEVHQLLIARRGGDAHIERDVSIAGFTRRPLTFNFRDNGCLIDCIPATSQSSAFEVRKLLDLRSVAAHNETEVLIIVDDRHDPKRAAEEMDLISRLANAQGFTSLRASASASQVLQ